VWGTKFTPVFNGTANIIASSSSNNNNNMAVGTLQAVCLLGNLEGGSYRNGGTAGLNRIY
jgi:hypothetical protein